MSIQPEHNLELEVSRSIHYALHYDPAQIQPLIHEWLNHLVQRRRWTFATPEANYAMALGYLWLGQFDIARRFELAARQADHSKKTEGVYLCSAAKLYIIKNQPECAHTYAHSASNLLQWSSAQWFTARAIIAVSYLLQDNAPKAYRSLDVLQREMKAVIPPRDVIDVTWWTFAAAVIAGEPDYVYGVLAEQVSRNDPSKQRQRTVRRVQDYSWSLSLRRRIVWRQIKKEQQ